MGSPILLIPLAAAAIVCVVIGVLTLGTCGSYNVSLVWFGIAGFIVAAIGGMFGQLSIVAFGVVFGLLCLAVGFFTMPAGCAFAWQV